MYWLLIFLKNKLNTIISNTFFYLFNVRNKYQPTVILTQQYQLKKSCIDELSHTYYYESNEIFVVLPHSVKGEKYTIHLETSKALNGKKRYLLKLK